MKSNYWWFLSSGIIIIISIMSLQKNLAQTIINIFAVQAPELVADAGDNATIDVGDEITIGGSPTATGGSGSYTYQWNHPAYLNNPAIANPGALPPGNLTFTVTVTDDEGCSDSDGISIIVIGGTGINDSKTNINLSIFPNPGNGTFTILIANTYNERQLKIIITNLAGQKVYEEIYDVKVYLEKEIDISHLSKGFYILTIDWESTHADRQLILLILQ